jgi:hypothetical protein
MIRMLGPLNIGTERQPLAQARHLPFGKVETFGLGLRHRCHGHGQAILFDLPGHRQGIAAQISHHSEPFAPRDKGIDTVRQIGVQRHHRLAQRHMRIGGVDVWGEERIVVTYARQQASPAEDVAKRGGQTGIAVRHSIARRILRRLAEPSAERHLRISGQNDGDRRGKKADRCEEQDEKAPGKGHGLALRLRTPTLREDGARILNRWLSRPRTGNHGRHRYAPRAVPARSRSAGFLPGDRRPRLPEGRSRHAAMSPRPARRPVRPCPRARETGRWR